MAFKITEQVSWVGKIDWSLKHFHGEELSTFRGSSYNSYLIRDEKTVLIDTVWGPFAQEFVENLKREIDLNQIDYIVSLHGETDHSGALSLLLKEIPNTPVYCTANGVKSLKGQYHQNWNFVPVKTGDVLDLGKNKLQFIEARMLHWPDTMFAYLTGEDILFSSDAFGQHYASEEFFDDLVNQGELWQEAMKYYTNILNPFSPMVAKKLAEVEALNLSLQYVCPAHGVIWRGQIAEIFAHYKTWAASYQEHQVTIVYDTMWGGTGRLAAAFTEGLKEADPTLVVKTYVMGKADPSDCLTDIFKAKLILVGSPTVNNGVLSPICAILGQIKELKFKGKKAVAFGAYGWSGEAVGYISERLADAGFQVVNPGLKVTWSPDETVLADCKKLGKDLGASLKA